MTEAGQSVGDRLLWIVLGWALAQVWDSYTHATLKTSDKHVVKAWRDWYHAERDLARRQLEQLR